MGNTVVDHRQDAGIAEQDFIHAARRGVAVEGGKHVAVEQAADARQLGGELANGCERARPQRGFIAFGVARGVVEFQSCLGQQPVQRRVQRMGDVQVLAFLAQIGRPQPHGKQHALQGGYHLRQRIVRRQVAPAWLQQALLAFAPLLAHLLQGEHDLADLEVSHCGTPRACVCPRDALRSLFACFSGRRFAPLSCRREREQQP